MAARLEPSLDRTTLRGVGVRARDIGDQQPADGQPFFDVGEVVGNLGRNVAFGEEAQEPQAGIVVIVPSHRTDRKTTGNQMRASGFCLCHRITSLAIRCPKRCAQFLIFSWFSPTLKWSVT